VTDRRSQPASIGERWRKLASLGEANRLEQAVAALPSIRDSRVRIIAGSIQAELLGAMGSIHEVAVHVPRLPTRIWPQVVRVMRRSATMREALREGRVPRSFDRLIARIAGESAFPESRRVTSACTCGLPETPCRHVLALHELFARRLDERPYELLTLRGVELRQLLEEAARPRADESSPPLAFGSTEEPVLFPEGEDGDLDATLGTAEIRDLIGAHSPTLVEAADAAIAAYVARATAAEPSEVAHRRP
jgi:uncharacterized Zn finger protein